MLIQESDLAVSRGGDVFSMLESMEYLTEEESTYDAAMVPVVENGRIGANVIALEDVMKFCESNGIEDMGYAVSEICESSQVDPSTIVFSIKEETALADDDMAQLAADVMSEGCSVVAVPPSPYDPLNEMAGMAVEACFYGDMSLLEAYANFDFYEFLDEGHEIKAKKAAKNMGMSAKDAQDLFDQARAAHNANNLNRQNAQEKADKDYFKNRAKAEKYGMDTTQYAFGKAPSLEDREKAEKNTRRAKLNKKMQDRFTTTMTKMAIGAKAGAKAEAKASVPTESKVQQVVKDAEKKHDPNFIARAIANLNTWANNVKAAYEKADPSKKGIFAKIKNAIARAIAYLTKKLGAEKYQAQMDAAK